MINKKISRTTFQAHLIDFVRDEMYEAAIKDDGIYSTFNLHNRYFTTGETKITLRYCKLDYDDKWLPAQRKIFYKDCPDRNKEISEVIDRIKMDVVKKDDAIWSTIKVEPFYDHFWVTYDKANNLEAKEDPHLTTSRYLRTNAGDVEIENTKRTLQRLEKNDINKSLTELHDKIYEQLGLTESLMNKLDTAEGLQKCWEKKEKEIADAGIPLRQYFPPLERLRMNSYYGLYPRRSGLTTYDFDEKAKEDLKASLKTWKASLDIYSPSKEFLNRVYGTYKKEEKEKKDMNITLMVVPNGMNKDFVRKVKANFQSNNSLRLFIASTDIDYSCEHEPIKTKYDLFEKWIKTGYVDVVYFMLGFEKDPDVRAFESFVRGFTEAEVPGKVDIHVVYQKDDICNDTNHLRTLYFDEADAKEDAARATGSVVKEAKAMSDVYSLDDEDLDIVKNSRGKIDASDELIIGKIMDVAFAEDEDAKPKKGGKK